METKTKITIKEKIKVLSQEQRVLKNQRKTIHLQGKRTMEPWQAFYKHQANRSELRELYFAYGIIKGRDIEVLKTENKHYVNMDNVNKLVEEYGTTLRLGE